MFRRKSFALLKLFQNIQELFTQNVPNNQKCSVEKVLHFWNCSRTFKNFLPKIFQINGNIPKHCKVFPRNVQSKSFWKMFMKHSKIVSKQSDMFCKHFSVWKTFWVFINMSRLLYFPKSSETFSLFKNIPECSGIFQICFENILKFCFGNISKVFRNVKMFSEVSETLRYFSKMFRNILTCLIDCAVSECFETFSLSQNIQICSRNI